MTEIGSCESTGCAENVIPQNKADARLRPEERRQESERREELR